MKFNEKNAIIKNVMSKEEVEEIYWLVEKSYNKYLMKTFTQTVSDFDLPYRIAKKIIAHAEEISGECGLEIESYQFAKYNKVVDEDGSVLMPNLTPHCDLTFPEPRFTFDYQIGGNTSWPLYVEGEKYVLSNNEALTFSGTHQVHWRERKTFSDTDYIDMVFFHLKKRVGTPYSPSVIEEVQHKIDGYMEMYQNGKYDG